MGRTGKLIAGLIFFIAGMFIAYMAYANNLIDLILVLGIIIAIIGIIFILMSAIDSSADKTRDMIKDYIEEKSNVDLSELSLSNSKDARNQETQNGPLRIRRDYDDYDQEFFYDDDDMIYVEHDDDEYQEQINPSNILKPRNVEEETYNFGDNLEFTPNYEKPIKITRAPKKREKGFFDDDYGIEVVEDKSESIKQSLYGEPQEAIPNLRKPQSTPARDIKIDINNPESLPIPKLLNSFIISDDEIITTDVAFERLAENISKEVMLEIPSLNDLSDKFLSRIPTIYSRVIIQDFDVNDMAYMILVASLLKQGVQIKTLSNVNTINFIVDDSRALILSNGRSGNDVEYGAIYNDVGALSEIRASFEKTWNLAHDLDQDIILRYMEAGA